MNFIVAEIGVNWDGDFQIAEEMIKKAKTAGCDAVKFQAFNDDVIGEHPERKRLMKTRIFEDNIEKINKLAKEADIEWFCTPMYPGAVDLLEPYVSRFKIRMADSINIVNNQKSEILDRILHTNKEIIISSEKSPIGCKYYKNDKIKWLYVVPKYPCELTDLDFKNIKDFDGYSNHCPNIIAPLSASILGSKIIEVHVTLDKSKNFFDNNVSFDYDELSELIKLIRLSEKIKK